MRACVCVRECVRVLAPLLLLMHACVCESVRVCCEVCVCVRTCVFMHISSLDFSHLFSHLFALLSISAKNYFACLLSLACAWRQGAEACWADRLVSHQLSDRLQNRCHQGKCALIFVKTWKSHSTTRLHKHIAQTHSLAAFARNICDRCSVRLP